MFGQDLNWTTVFQYPLCQTINLEDYMDLSENTPQEVQIYLGNVTNLGVNLHFIDKRKSCTRTLVNNYLAYNGPSIEMSDLITDNTTQLEVIVKLSQNIKTEQDPESQCKNYPFENFLNYNDCDQTYLQKLHQAELGITPFWATQDLANVTNIKTIG